MKIYILEVSIHYESHVFGAYSTEAKAQKEEADWLKDNPDNNGSSIIELVLDS